MKRLLPFVVLVMSLACFLQFAGCGGETNGTGDADSIPETEECLESAVETWINSHLDSISEEIGTLVTGDLPIAKGLAAGAVKTALLASLQWEIGEVEALEGKQEQIARVRLTFPLELKLVVISEEHRIQVDYVLRIRDCTVVDSYLDLDSFHME